MSKTCLKRTTPRIVSEDLQLDGLHDAALTTALLKGQEDGMLNLNAVKRSCLICT